MKKHVYGDSSHTAANSPVTIAETPTDGELPNRLMTAFEVAAFVGCHEETVRRAYLRGLLASQRFGVRHRRFRPARRSGLDPARRANQGFLDESKERPKSLSSVTSTRASARASARTASSSAPALISTIAETSCPAARRALTTAKSQRSSMFISGPPVSASPRPLDVRNVISCTFAVSTLYPDTPPPPRDAPTFMPSTCRRPSLVGPPWMPNVTIPGCQLHRGWDRR